MLTMAVAIEAVERAFRALHDGSFLLHSRKRFDTPNGIGARSGKGIGPFREDLIPRKQRRKRQGRRVQP